MTALHILASDIDEYIESYKKKLIYDTTPILTSWEKEVIHQCVEDCGFELSTKDDVLAVDTEGKKEKEHNLVFVVHGPFTLDSSALFHTSNGQFRLQALIFHEDFLRKRYEQIAKQLIQEKSIAMPAGSDEEYLLEMLRDAEESIRWEKAISLAPGASIWDVRFDEWGHFARKELDVVPL